MYHGSLMQAYWAYGCRAHFVGAVANLSSTIISPVGHTIASSTNYFPRVTARINTDCAVVHLDDHWEKLAAMKEKYGREIDIFDPGLLAPVLITSRAAKRTAGDLMAEFQMTPVGDYLDCSRAARRKALASRHA